MGEEEGNDPLPALSPPLLGRYEDSPSGRTVVDEDATDQLSEPVVSTVRPVGNAGRAAGALESLDVIASVEDCSVDGGDPGGVKPVR